MGGDKNGSRRITLIASQMQMLQLIVKSARFNTYGVVSRHISVAHGVNIDRQTGRKTDKPTTITLTHAAES